MQGIKTKQLYFDSEQLDQGNYFNLHSEILTEEGHHYELEDWINRGGNATVYQCRHRVTGEEYAIKFLMNLRFNNTKRFLREVKLLQSIQGDHITKYHGTGRVTVKHNKYAQCRLVPFVIMELAERNLQDVLHDHEGSLSYEQYAGQFRGLARALSILHSVAIHRDIKPENILVSGERWLLSDYGLCTYVNPKEDDLTIAREGQNIGPKFWLSPEAHNRRLGCGDQINTASDVFQMAAIFWYVVTGRHPSGIVTENDWTGPEKLFRVLQKSLFHDYTKRPQNGEEFFIDLADALSQ